MSEHPLPSSIRPRADRTAHPAPSSAAGNEPSSAAHREKHETGGKTEQPAEHLINVLAVETGIAPHRIRAAVALLDADNSVPFIARYRKEATGALTDTQLRTIQSRLGQLRALEERRNRVLEALTERADEGLIDPLTLLQLRSSLMNAATIADVNAIYAPYRSERVTRAQMARAAGLDSLVEDLLEVPLAEAHAIAAAYITDGTEDDEDESIEVAEADEALQIHSAEEALDGARAILVDRALTDPVLSEKLLKRLREGGVIESRVIAGQESIGAKFSDYFAFSDRIRSIPPHRVLALHRAKDAGVVRLKVDVAPAPVALSRLRGAARAEAEAAAENYENVRSAYEREVAAALRIPVQVLNTVDDEDRVLGWLAATVRTAWRSHLRPRLAERIRHQLLDAAAQHATEVFASNLRDILLAAPAGHKTTLGLDPGLRHGVKYAVVDGTGEPLRVGTVYPHAPRNQWAEALRELAAACREHGVELIAIGNGTASRETDKLASELIRTLREEGAEAPQKVTVSEAGASVYSASALATAELPDYDVTVRGAVSIARRLQDPLAELVKIDPQSIGVGQYQHDVPPAALRRALNDTIEDCVNAVGVNLNSASVQLLAHVAGVGTATAERIVAYRTEHGAFTNRQQLLNVPRLGAKTFRQAAGFIRIRGGEEPLDASAVHPEAYPLARRIIADAQARNGAHWVTGALGTSDGTDPLAGLNPADYVQDSHEQDSHVLESVEATAGVYTVEDIFAELRRPGLDPRGSFRTARFSESVSHFEDVRPGMVLEGTVSNVAAFGAFVDIGVHQDGLVHISQMSRGYVANPHDIVRSGDIVQVRVVEVDPVRRRISLSLLVEDEN
ncbi:MAG: RNA-binding transcriptional accessory protein [Rothia mucilaginosa]|uniref:helix-hairpin-helix domain-containing protein n=1 Tax=Rothia mucilaginosa TaxID=43675 RepID=UPI001CB1794E|nr:Tex family protein [Rothia mucilaginosa]MBF1672004.1 RNA-binding transcriptional accessory protein [Rothia mucilaginosa]